MEDPWEDDDQEVYYEVEKIVDMYITEAGVRMFELKWKNYEHEYQNTWEPEHNLNCPEIKEAFLDEIAKEKRKAIEDRLQPDKKKSMKEKRKTDKMSKADPSIAAKKAKTSKYIDYSRVPPVIVATAQKTTTAIDDKKPTSSWPNNNTLSSDQLSAKKQKLSSSFSKRPGSSNSTSSSTSSDGGLGSTKNIAKKTHYNLHGQGPLSEALKNARMEQNSVNHNSKTTIIDVEYDAPETSFTSIKRNKPSNLPTSATPPVEIDKILNSVRNNQQLSSPKSPKHPSLSARSYPLHQPINSNTTHKTPLPTHESTINQHRKKPDFHYTISSPHPTSTANNGSNSVNRTEPFLSSLPSPLSSIHPQRPTTSSSDTNRDTRHMPPPSRPLDTSLPAVTITKPAPLPSTVPTAPAAMMPAGETLPVKRQLSIRDPRLAAAEKKRAKQALSPTPFRLETTLYKGSKLVSQTILESTPQCYHDEKIRNLLTVSSDNHPNQIRISSYLSFKRVGEFLIDRPMSFMTLTAISTDTVELSKLTSFMKVNDIASMISHESLPTQAIILMPDALLSKLHVQDSIKGLLPAMGTTAGATWSRFVAIYLEDLPKRPKHLSRPIDSDKQLEDGDGFHNWIKVTDFLKFPEELKAMKTKAKFIVYGTSAPASLLNKATSRLPELTNPPAHVMMFDRANDQLFNKYLKKHKKEPSTQIWEFGVPNFSNGDMMPATQVFPNNSGGFVTTDVENIMTNPAIIDDICSQLDTLNSIPVVYGQWKFVLPHTLISLLTLAAKHGVSSDNYQTAIINITIALSEGRIEIIQLWTEEEQQQYSDFTEFMTQVARKYHTESQYFVYVDDISAVDRKVDCLDFVTSNALAASFM